MPAAVRGARVGNSIKQPEETTIRKHIHFALVTLAAVIAAGGGAVAEEAGKMTLVPSEAAVPWQAAPPSLPKGTQLAVLAGDPGKPGPFALFVKFPPNTLVAPHRHATAENLTVLSGDFYHGMGETVDKAHGNAMKPGGFVYLPGGMPHYVWTTTSEAVVQVTGTGPFGLDYVHPEDDPSRTH